MTQTTFDEPEYPTDIVKELLEADAVCLPGIGGMFPNYCVSETLFRRAAEEIQALRRVVKMNLN